MIKTISWL